jgi:hypothetical protein
MGFLSSGATMCMGVSDGLEDRGWCVWEWGGVGGCLCGLSACEGQLFARHEFVAPAPFTRLLGTPSCPCHRAGALGLAARDAEAAGVRHLLRLHQGDCAEWQLPRAPTLVVSNPPWGQRLMGGEGVSGRQAGGAWVRGGCGGGHGLVPCGWREACDSATA